MAWRVTWHLECDHCGKQATFSGQPSSTVERKALRYGWRFVLDQVGLIRHLCKACSRNPDIAELYVRKDKSHGAR